MIVDVIKALRQVIRVSGGRGSSQYYGLGDVIEYDLFFRPMLSFLVLRVGCWLRNPVAMNAPMRPNL